jgi:hypothetical protein
MFTADRPAKEMILKRLAKLKAALTRPPKPVDMGPVMAHFAVIAAGASRKGSVLDTSPARWAAALALVATFNRRKLRACVGA